jgi:hypothetical protein
MNKTIWMIATVVTIILLAVLVSFQLMGNEEIIVDAIEEVPAEDVVLGLTETNCTDAGGAWNACGSACRTEPGAPCIELCIEQCECEGDHQCPAEHQCDEYVEEVGVCKIF